MTKPRLRMRQVFVPGGQPEHTYVTRDKLGLERQLQTASDNLCKLVTVTGPTKSGKSVLTKKVYPGTEAVWIDGGSIGNEEDLWLGVIEKLDGFVSITRTTTRGRAAEMAGQASAQLEIPLLARAQVEVTPKYGQTRTSSETKERRGSPKSRALEQLRESKRPLIVDDFHYLERETQGSVVRGLKALVFDGHPVILLAIPHRKYDAIRVEKEMTGRVQQIPIPAWRPDELRQIADLGFPLLDATIDTTLVDGFLRECLQSPHLMQEFCRQICESNGIEERCETQTSIVARSGLDILFHRVAADTTKTVFDRLAKGAAPAFGP